MTTLTHELLPLLPRYRHRAAGPLPWQVASPAAFKVVSKERIHKNRHRRMLKKSPSSKAAGELKPEAYPRGYVEDFDESRTKLAGF